MNYGASLPSRVIIRAGRELKDKFSSTFSFYGMRQVKTSDLPEVSQLVRDCAGARHMSFSVLILYYVEPNEIVISVDQSICILQFCVVPPNMFEGPILSVLSSQK